MREHLLASSFFKGHPDESGGRFVKPDRQKYLSAWKPVGKTDEKFSSCSTLVLKRCKAESNVLIANKTELLRISNVRV